MVTASACGATGEGEMPCVGVGNAEGFEQTLSVLHDAQDVAAFFRGEDTFDGAGFTLEVMVEASISRLRPVLLAAGTTIAGMSPLLGDAFFMEMAVCIMSGLAFATLITLFALPVFYKLALGSRVST